MINTFQLIPQKDKGIGFVKSTAFEIIQEAESQFTSEVAELQKLWDVYNGEFNAKKFEYLTKVEGDLSYPAKVRDIASQLVRSRINKLESEQARRKPRFKAGVSDERSQKKKYEQRMKAVMDAIETTIEDQYEIIKSSIQQISDQQNDLEQQLQVQPENEEAQAQLEQLKANMPMIRLELGKMMRTLERQGADMDAINEKVKYFRQFNEVEIIEQIANAFIKALHYDTDKRENFNRGFREKLVTGRPTYLINFNEKTKKVDFKQIDSIRSFYSKGSNNRWTQNGEWCATLEYMSLSQATADFDLSPNEVGMLQSYVGGSYNAMYSYNYNVAVFNPTDSKERVQGGIPVWRVWWLSPREWWWKRSPNKKRPGTFFNHVIVDQPDMSKLKNDETLERNLLYDRYSAVILGNVLCKTNEDTAGIDYKVYRPKDTPGIPHQPLVARTFNTESDKPYSLIQRTADLRDLYNIIWYSLELNIVLSGVRGMIMDKSQKPDKMSTEQWMYYRKLGTMWIETMKKGRKIPATFNQFQNYDDTLSQSIGTTFEILNGIDGMIAKIMGISDAGMQQTISKDPVHNVMMSQEQSSLVTEIQFYEADLVYAMAITEYLNLALQFELKEGKVINYLDENLQEVLFKIPAGLLNQSDFKINAWNNIQEDHMLDLIRSQAAATVPIDGLASLYRVESLTEMEKRLTQIIIDQSNRATQSAQSIDNNKAQQEQVTAKLKNELDMYAQQTKDQLENAKIELQKLQLDTDLQYKQWEMQFKEKELEVKKDLGLLGIAGENEVESAYLGETSRNNRVQEALEANRQKLEALIQMHGMAVNKEMDSEKHATEIKKAEITAVRRKNNIKD